MKKSGYVPAQGDLVWFDFDPQAGHEQGGRRPAIVLSPKAYNKLIGLALVCPVTSREKGYPFEVRISAGLPVRSSMPFSPLSRMKISPSFDFPENSRIFKGFIPVSGHDLRSADRNLPIFALGQFR